MRPGLGRPGAIVMLFTAIIATAVVEHSTFAVAATATMHPGEAIAAATQWPNASNTGVPPGTRLTAVAGDLHVTTRATVIDALDVAGRIYVEADDVTIMRTRAAGGLSAFRGSNQLTTITDSDFGPTTGRADTEGVSIVNTSIMRSSIHNFPDGIRSNGGNRITDNWIHDFSLLPDDHNDGIQRYAPGVDAGDGRTEVIRHNFIDCIGCTNSAIFYADNWTGRLIVDGNYIRGGGYGVRLHESGTVKSFKNNRMEAYATGPCSTARGKVLSWSGNVNARGVAVRRGDC